MASSENVQKKIYNIVLVGKTGNGKSSTGNTIINQKLFLAELGSSSVTKTCTLQSVEFDNVILNVVDTPGLADTNRSKKEIWGELVDVMSLCTDGFHAFLYVIPILSRYTNEEIQTLRELTKFFGSSFIQVCIIAFTYGDTLALSEKPKEFNDWLKEQTGEMKTFIEECKYRCLLFYNNTRYEFYEQKRLETLGKLVELIQVQNMNYKDEHFNTAVEGRKRLSLEEKVPELEAKYQTQLSLITGEIMKAAKNMNEEMVEKAEKQVKKLQIMIEEDANGTNIFETFKTRLNVVAKSINTVRSSIAAKKKSDKESEISKNESEKSKQEAEISKIESEKSKQKAEKLKIESEKSKKEAEISKNESEKSKKEAELSKKESEKSKKESEKLKIESEKSKKVAEILKKESEKSNKESEVFKKEAEESTRKMLMLKIAEYNELIKNPPNTIGCKLAKLAAIVISVGGAITVAVTSVIPPLALVGAAVAATAVNALMTSSKNSDIDKYNNQLETVIKEIENLENKLHLLQVSISQQGR